MVLLIRNFWWAIPLEPMARDSPPKMLYGMGGVTNEKGSPDGAAFLISYSAVATAREICLIPKI